MVTSHYTEPNLKTKIYAREEISWIDEAIPEDTARVHPLIEWVENLDTSLYFWPHSLREDRETSVTRTYDNKN